MTLFKIPPFHVVPQEVQEFNQSFIEQASKLPSVLNLSFEEIRARDAVRALEKSSIASDRYIVGPSGNQIRLRQFLPEKVRGVYLYFHGGGWVTGAADWQDARLEEIAVGAQLAVVSVEYRLAPEHPYPAAVDDCEAAALWLIENALREFGTDELSIGGGSAGAHLCVLTLLRMRDKHSYTRFKRANLMFGVYDLSLTPSARRWGSKELILSTPIMEKLVDSFLPEGIDRCSPAVSPLYADLRNMPPALFTVGTLDPLLDDTLFMYMRWVSAGNAAELLVCSGGIHGFVSMQTPQTDKAKATILEFLHS